MQSPQNPQRRLASARSARSALIVACLLTVSCGKSGPPLPPIVRVPAAPENFVAERRGATVDLQLTVPAVNVDGSRPANIARVDVFAITGPTSVTDEQILEYGKQVAAVAVKSPRNPDKAVDPDDPDTDLEQPEGEGLDQGSIARVAEPLTSEALVPFDPATDPKSRDEIRTNEEEVPRPLLGPPPAILLRTYVGVGISTRGRKGPMSSRVTVPLVPPPPPPEKPTVTYGEEAVTVKWPPIAVSGMVQEPATDDVLPSTPVGVVLPTITYNVYDVTPDAAAASGAESASGSRQTEGVSGVGRTPQSPPGSTIRLTETPVSQPQFNDSRIVWGETRCYTVRTVETVSGLMIESDASPPECTTLTDTFAPAAPKNLQAVPGEGTVSLIWDPSPEKDFAGYLVLRGAAPDGVLERLTPTPIQDPRFNDTVKAGVPYAYVVTAVDRAGNISAESNRVEETAR